jgi:hypothetical protein
VGKEEGGPPHSTEGQALLSTPDENKNGQPWGWPKVERSQWKEGIKTLAWSVRPGTFPGAGRL